MRLWTRERPDRTDWDRVWARVAQIQTDLERLENGWGDMKDQLRRSYQRLEKAAQRAERVAPSDPCLDDCPEGEEGAPVTLQDKIRDIRGG